MQPLHSLLYLTNTWLAASNRKEGYRTKLKPREEFRAWEQNKTHWITVAWRLNKYQASTQENSVSLRLTNHSFKLQHIHLFELRENVTVARGFPYLLALCFSPLFPPTTFQGWRLIFHHLHCNFPKTSCTLDLQEREMGGKEDIL